MTIRKRLARSNLIMILIPVAIAAALLLLGGGLAVLLLKRVYLPRLGLSMAALHETGEQLEARLKTSLEAQSRQQQKQELIAGMSHDLKSPLTSIRAYTEGLLDGVAKDEQTQARYLQTIYAKETEIETLVNRLFSFAKLDLSEAPAKPEALEISRTFAEIAAGFEAEGLDVWLGDLPDETVMADRELLSRCMSNLLDNSRKYGASHVVISADISGDTVSISVSDDGPGVEASQLEKIFELGYRTDSARQIRS